MSWSGCADPAEHFERELHASAAAANLNDMVECQTPFHLACIRVDR